MIRFREDFLSEMAMSQPGDERQKELFRPALEALIAMDHPLERLAGKRLGLSGAGAARQPIGWPYPRYSHQGH